jgi:aldehyde dehydrogenase (NAD+)
VQETVYELVVAKLRERMTHLRVGDSLDKCIDMGAVVDEKHRKSIEDYVQKARDEGNTVYQAAACIPESGCFYPPTLITDVDTSSTVVQVRPC